MIGIPSLCAAAIVVTIALGRHSDIAAPPSWSAYLPAIGFAAMIAAFILFFSSLKAAGVDVSSQSEPLKELPNGVSGYVGWANRFLFLASYFWVILASTAVVRAQT
jgi:membrane protein required for beta-lactamase induction